MTSLQLNFFVFLHNTTLLIQQFRLLCKENGITRIKTTPKYAQANREVERQNASFIKRIKTAQSDGFDWKKRAEKVCDGLQEHHPQVKALAFQLKGKR